MSIANNTLATHIATVSNANMTRRNFPLPRELRDEIYAYLLDAKYAKSVTTDPRIQVFRFHTNILLVNHEVREEAQEDLKHAGLAEVVNVSAPRFQSHSLRLHLDWKGHPNSVVKSLVTFHGDVDTLIAFIKATLQKLPGKAVCITSAGADQLRFRVTDNAPKKNIALHTKIQLRDTPLKALNADLQQRILRPFSILSSPLQKVSIVGTIPDEPSAAKLRTVMCPKIVWARAQVWDTAETILALKSNVDRLVEAGEWLVAAYEYYAISYMLHSSFVFQVSFDFGMSDADPDCAAAFLFAKVVMLECVANSQELFLRLDKDNPFVADPRSIFILAAHDPLLPKSLHARFVHLRAMELITFRGVAARPSTEAFVDAMDTIAECMDEVPGDAGRLHDFDVVAAHLVEHGCHPQSHNHRSDLPPLDRTKTSFHIFPFKLMDYTSELPPPPDHIRGLQDAAAMKQLSAADKEQIHRVQRVAGIPETNFSVFP
ncbi:hypothetical protein H2203_008415 [Taxawa tesnikishii (nom. ined.)]|nr:hypothetical protein H2203_008415 [Dothideales sp. JES 119]